MDINVIRGFLNGETIVFEPESKEFFLSYRAPTDKIKVLDTDFSRISALSRHFFQEIQRDLVDQQDEIIHLSAKLVEKLSVIDVPLIQQTVEKIKQSQTHYKTTHRLLSADSPDFLKKDVSYVLNSVKEDGMLIRFADISLRDNKKIALMAVMSNPQAYRYVSMRLKNDESICIESFSQRGILLKFAPFDQKNNPDVALPAILSDPVAFMYVSDDLRNNEDFLIEILGHNLTLYDIFPESIKNDPNFQKKALDILEIHEGFKKSIVEYNNPQIREFLVSKVLATAQYILDHEGKSSLTSSELSGDYSLAEISPNLIKVSLKTWQPDKSDQTELINFLSKHKKALKHAPRRQTLLMLMKELDDLHIDDQLKIKLALRCMDSTITLEEAIERAAILPLLARLLTEDELKTVDNFSSAHLKNIITEELVSHKILKEENKVLFLEKMQSCRIPSAFFNYAKAFFQEEIMLQNISHFVSWICDDNFIEKRHEKNTFGDYLSPEQKLAWETPLKQSDSGFVFLDSEDWQDLLLCGTEVIGSCQRVDGDREFNCCLMGYVLDGKIRVLCKKNHEDGPILSRCILKLILRPDDALALIIEKIYPEGEVSDFEAMIELARQKAISMGVELYRAIHSDDHGTLLKSPIANFASHEYEDGSVGLGITNGIYNVNAVLIQPREA